MNRQNTMLTGVLAIVVILGLGLVLGVLPQNRAAADARSTTSQVDQTNQQLTAQLASLREQKEDLSGLKRDLGELREQIPTSADLASVTRVIVKALESPGRAKGSTLVSITPQVPPIPFVPREQLTADIGLPEVVPPAPSGGAETGKKVPEGAFQQIPLTITATSPDVRAAFRFVDWLNNGPRLLAVHHVEITTSDATGSDAGGDPVTVSVMGAAYLQPSDAK